MVFVPPAFNDLGKSCKDLFSKGFYLGEVKLEHKSKTRTGLELTASGSLPRDSDRMSGSIESKYKIPKYGATVTLKWTAESTLQKTVEVEDKFAKGLKLTNEASIDFASSKRSCRTKVEYKRDRVHLNTDVDCLPSASSKEPPLFTQTAVFGHNGYMLGGLIAIDMLKRSLAKHALALGYLSDEVALNATLTEGSAGRDVLAQYHQKIAPGLEYALQVKWNSAKNTSQFTAGFSHSPDALSTFKAYVNNDQLLGLSYAHKLRPGVKLTFSTALNAKLFIGAGAPAAQPHRVGFGLEFDSTA